MDHVKVGCSEKVLKELIHVLVQIFGKVEIEITIVNCTVCGITHKSIPQGYEMDQNAFVTALKPINSVYMTGKPDNEKADYKNAKCFLCLLMASRLHF